MSDTTLGAAPPQAQTRLRLQPSATTLSAAFFVALGLGFVVLGRDYRVGDLRSMGPGMFPTAGGYLLALLGGLTGFSGPGNSDPVEPVVIRPLFGVLASVIAFALLVNQVGLLIAGPVLIGGALLATGQGTLKQGLILSLVLTTTSSVVFPTLLGVPLKVFP